MCKLQNVRVIIAAALCGLIFAILLSTIALAQEQVLMDISVNVLPMMSAVPHHGYREVKVSIANRSASRAHVVSLKAPAEQTSFPYTGYISSLTKTVVVEPRSEVIVSLMVPGMELGGSELLVRIDGAQVKPNKPLNSGLFQQSGYGGYGTTGTFILVSRSLKTEAMQDRANKLLSGTSEKSSTAYYPTQEITYSRSDLSSDLWSSNWLAYSGYDGIIVGAEDLKQMPEQVKAALWRYAASGGTLAIAGGTEIPGGWGETTPLKAEAPTVPASAKEPDEKLVPKESLGSSPASLDASYVGFGCAVPLPFDGTASLTDTQLKDLIGLFKDTSEPWYDTGYYPRSDPNELFPVAGSTKVPVRGLMLLMLAFVLAVGPANLFVLSKYKRRLWLLWTVPAISLVTCLAVWLYASFAEGWRAYSRIEAVTALDETTNEAATIAMAGYYSPLTPRRGLRFDYDTEITPIGNQGGDRRIGHSINLDKCQHLESGWIAARVPAHFMLRKCESRRERLVVRKDAATGELSAVNGLGADITEAYFMDGAGNLYTATNIPAGSKAKLSLKPSRPPAYDRPFLRTLYSAHWSRSVQQAADAAQYALRPNQYVAIMEGTPFMEPGLSKATSKDSRSAVFGLKGGLDES